MDTVALKDEIKSKYGEAARRAASGGPVAVVLLPAVVGMESLHRRMSLL